HAGRTPERLALRFPGRDLSYAALARLVDRYAAGLTAAGVERGRCVAYLGLNSPDEIALLFACARLGAMFMPLNWRLAAPEHRQILVDCPPAVLFVEAPFVAQTETLRASLGATTLVACGTAAQGWIDGETFLAQAEQASGRHDGTTDESGGAHARTAGGVAAGVGPDTPLLLCYTSGSTGKPKGVMLTQGALECNAANSADMHDLVPEDRVLTTLPLFHVGGLNNQSTPALCMGCTLVLHPKFDVEATFDAIERERITLTVLVPAQLDAMLAHPRWTGADFSSLRMITTGSMIVPERLIRAVHARGVPLVQVYGSTETCPIAAYLKAGEAGRKIGSTGRAAAHCELRLVDDAGRDVAPGATGEILVRGGNVMSGYWNAPQATAAVLVNGWFHTGDMGHFDAEGYLYVDGRRKEMIISGGENIYPAEIENILNESPAIAEASVVGWPDPRWGEVAVAVVALEPGHRLTEDEVVGLLEGRIARFKHPKQVVFVDGLPKTALGKVRREEVRRLVSGNTVPG
ncbi:MAG: long-chain fatty acid--CoA ligase, partial [Burkholderiaceae bacterium]|nr:long-chain fatty acid--CoA ligase [Burkholderiaceae bacterium]